MNDPEHMAMLDRVKSQGGSGPAPLPPLAWWSPEVDMSATVNDTLMMIKDVLVRANTGKDHQSKIPPVKFTPRPGRQEDTSKKMAKLEEQKARHEKAVALFLPQEHSTDG